MFLIMKRNEIKRNEINRANEINRGAVLMSAGFLLALFFFVVGLHYPSIGHIGILLSFVLLLIGQILAFRDLKKYKE
jgi:Flp pilus assembly protein TadB